MGRTAERVTPELRQALLSAREAIVRELRLEADGRDILAALAARGVMVRLGAYGRPVVGPRERVDEADLAILAAHREAVLAALAAVELESETAEERPELPMPMRGTR